MIASLVNIALDITIMTGWTLTKLIASGVYTLVSGLRKSEQPIQDNDLIAERLLNIEKQLKDISLAGSKNNIDIGYNNVSAGSEGGRADGWCGSSSS